MKLNVFPRGQVTSPGRVIVCNSRQHAKLRRLQHTRCDLHSQHLEARLSLAIGAMLQAERPKLLGGDGPALKLLSALFKTDDFRFNSFASMPFFNFRYCRHGHKSSLPGLASEMSSPKRKSPHNQSLWHVGFRTL